MKYTKEKLIKELESGIKHTYFGFWGQRFESENAKSFSNFYMKKFKAKIIKNGEEKLHTFECSEQFFMYKKAIFFEDYIVADKILKSGNSPKEYKNLGRQVGNIHRNLLTKPFDEEAWTKVSYDKMVEVLLEKYKDPVLKQRLLDTGSAILVEASAFDKIWGVGFSQYDKYGNPSVNGNWKKPEKWLGENKLGFALMEVRDMLV